MTVRESAVTGLPGYVDVVFAAKPDAEIRQGLKDHGFRWAKAASCWYGPDAAYAASLATV